MKVGYLRLLVGKYDRSKDLKCVLRSLIGASGLYSVYNNVRNTSFKGDLHPLAVYLILIPLCSILEEDQDGVYIGLPVAKEYYT